MLRAGILLAGCIVGGIAFAAVTTTIVPGKEELQKPDRTVIATDIADCSQAAQAEFARLGVPSAEFRCEKADTVKLLGDCSDKPPPEPETSTIVETRTDLDVDEQGKQTGKTTTIEHVFTNAGSRESFLCPGSDSDYYFVDKVQVKGAFPNCWTTQTTIVNGCPAK